jgi:uncharacterized membrane protein YgcG
MLVRGTTLALASFAFITASSHSALAQQSRSLPTPASVLGFEPGADRHLPSWKQITDYFTALDKASPRVTVRTLGKTVLGRPFIVAIIADSSTLANLEHYRQIQRKLMDPRLQAANEREHRLARAADPEAKQILANTIILMVPSQNPDGVDIVGDYYRSTLGTPNEGRDPPELYHHYAGHDDNRDWYAFTQPETRCTIDSLYTPWDPQIVNDIHQQGSNTSRIFIPPYMDPVEPNIDPILTAATNGLGMAMVWRMTNEGFTGIASNATYDQWSPARQYSLYHRGARLLTETASARLASPIDITFEQLGTGRGYDARVVSWNYPSLWTGGHWTYGDIVRYQTAASWALFLDAAQNRRAWLEGYAAMADRALAAQPAWGKDAWPSAIVIPKTQPDTQALRRMIWTLQHGQVEIREATAPVTVDNKSYPSGSYVVLTRQPMGGYAKALLERQHYPDLFDYPGGPPKRPYDVTAHTLPLIFGVDVAHVAGAPPATGPVLKEIPEPVYTSALSGKAVKRIAVYRPSTNEPIDEGWTRWVLDTYKIPFTTITEKDLTTPLNDRFDAIIFSEGTFGGRGGGGRGGRGAGGGGGASAGGGTDASAIETFVRNGGTVLAFNGASSALIDALKLPVKNVLAGVPNTDFYAPGSILGVEIKRDHPLAKQFVATVPAIWFENSPAFEISDPSTVTAVATYQTTGNPLLSGWLLGAPKLNGKAALVDAKLGRGHVVLYGFRPQYRGQANATYPLIWGALLE